MRGLEAGQSALSAAVWLALLAVACKSSNDDATWEGKRPGECADGADNDGDGAFDCKDEDCAGAPDCDGEPPTDEVLAAWDALLEDAQGWVDYNGVPGLAFAVVLDGELAFAEALGTTQSGGSIPLTVDTSLRWNSVSKFHTAMAAMQQVEAGQLDLHAPVVDLLPELTVFGADVEEITLHKAMTHTAALPDFWVTNCSTELDDWWQTWAPQLMVDPDAVFNYSNAGWSLAGRALEVVAGKSFLQIMQEDILDPAGMTTATFDVEAVMDRPHTIGYDGESFYTPDIHDCPYVRPAGWLHGTVLDLARMAELHLAGGEGLVTPESLDALSAPQVGTWFSYRTDYGYGLYNWQHRGVEMRSHSGGGAGHLSYWLIAPDQGFGIVAVTNSSWFSPYRIAERAADLFLAYDDDYVPPEYATDPASWSEYVGTYEDPVNVGTMEVTLDADDKLYVRFVDGSDVDRRLYQASLREFFYVFEGFNYIRFVPGDGDTYYLANRYFVGVRDGAVADSSAAPDSAENIVEIEHRGAQPEPREPGYPDPAW